MLKFPWKCVYFVLALALAGQSAYAQTAKPSKPSYSSGFSSKKQQSAPPANRGNFGTFERKASPASSRESTTPKKPFGGFGSAASSSSTDQRKSESALNLRLTQKAAEESALRTLEQRRRAQSADYGRQAPAQSAYDRSGDRYANDVGAARERQSPASAYSQRTQDRYGNVGQAQMPNRPTVPSSWIQPTPARRDNSNLGRVAVGGALAGGAVGAHANGGEDRAQTDGAYTQQPQAKPVQPTNPAPAPVIVRTDSGLGNVVAGAVLANAMTGAKANDGSPKPSSDTVVANSQAGAPAKATTDEAPMAGPMIGALRFLFFAILCLPLIALVGWIVYKGLELRKARREANKPNYTFERT